MLSTQYIPEAVKNGFQENTAYGLIHCHTGHSLLDSPLKVDDMVERGKDLQVKALSITDHGTCTGWIEFMNACNHAGIKPILGVEAYMKESDEKRRHLVLYAKNYEGYKEISCAVTESNERLDSTRSRVNYPLMSKALLQKHFGNGNVIASSACVLGVLNAILLENRETARNIEKLRKKQAAYPSPNNEEYVVLVMEKENLECEVCALNDERVLLTELAKKTYKKRQNALKVLEFEALQTEEGRRSYAETKRILESEMEATRQAKEELPGLRKRLASKKKSLTSKKSQCTKLEAKQRKYFEYETQIKELKASMKSEEAIYEEAKKEALWYKSLFGSDFYIELQYHGLEDEAYCYPILARLALELDIPTCVANDSHIRVKADSHARSAIQSMRFAKAEPITESETELYMKADAELYSALRCILTEEEVIRGFSGTKAICDACNVTIPDTPHYPRFRDESGNIVENTDKILRDKAYAAIPTKYKEFHDYERLEYELETIISMGFADYLLIVDDFVRYAKDLANKNSRYGIGVGVGPGRGSAAGSVVCYLLGITSVDPLQYGLRFQRFLNPERVSMPDIDMDYSKEVRADVMEYARRKYGEESTAFITTVTTQGAKGSLRNGAKVLSWERNLDKDFYINLGNRLASVVPQKPDTKLSECEEALSKFTGETEKTAIHYAHEMEGSTIAFSTHAAGVIIGDGTPLKEIVPLRFDSDSGRWAVQCDMVEAEQIKLLKMDFLGLVNLDIISECVRRIKRDTGTSIDIDTIPIEKQVLKKIFAAGDTACVFQFESDGMRSMLKEFKPDSFEDIILLVAAYRPGPMSFIPEMIQVKKKLSVPHYVVPQLESILAPTYGQPIYQEQLMDIFHECAGFSLGEADIIRRYMSKKKVDKFLSYKPQFVQGVMASGADKESAESFWESLVDFSRYAFNKSHAAVYAKISYITAYLKFHYPVQYMTAEFNNAPTEKLPNVFSCCREMGLKLLPPDINRSLAGYENKPDGIVCGLRAVKGVKDEAELIVTDRQQHGLYLSVKEFVARTNVNAGAAKALVQAGAFDGMQHSRRAILSCLDTIYTHNKTIERKKASVENLSAELEKATDTKEKAKLKKRLQTAEKTLDYTRALLSELEIPMLMEDDPSENLQWEHDLIGEYISAHPLDAYREALNDKHITHISSFQPGYGTYAGLIQNLKPAHRKSDGADMAFFKLEDGTGVLDVSCFTEAYAKYRESIKEGAVVKIYGKAYLEEYEDTERKKLAVKSVTVCKPFKDRILVKVPKMDMFPILEREYLEPYRDKSGHPVVVYDASTGHVQETDFYISLTFLDEKPDTVFAERIWDHKILNRFFES